MAREPRDAHCRRCKSARTPENSYVDRRGWIACLMCKQIRAARNNQSLRTLPRPRQKVRPPRRAPFIPLANPAVIESVRAQYEAACLRENVPPYSTTAHA